MVVGLLLATGASLTASILVLQIAVLPLLFKYSKTVQRKMVFSNFINYPRNLDYDSPSSSNIVGGKNLSVEFQSKENNCPVRLGVWHLLPCCCFRGVYVLKDDAPMCCSQWQELKTTHNDIVLYCHGNSNHRASPHRVQMYKVFQELNLHVITFDYRGYGDSTRVRPTERGAVEDVLQLYGRVRRARGAACGAPGAACGACAACGARGAGRAPALILWGHSLGTAIASNMAAHLPELCEEYKMEPLPSPDVLVLEAPFNNLMDEIECHPFSKCVSWLPYYKETFVKPFTGSSEFAFTTDQYLTKVPHLPILMLHSKGDKIVPYELAVKLHTVVARSRQNGGAPLVLHSFDKGQGLGHNNLCIAPGLKDVVKNFLQLLEKRDSNLELSNVKLNVKSS